MPYHKPPGYAYRWKDPDQFLIWLPVKKKGYFPLLLHVPPHYLKHRRVVQLLVPRAQELDEVL